MVLAFAPALCVATYVVNYPWVRPAAKGKTTEAFVEITSLYGGALVAARSGMAARVIIVGPGMPGKPVARLSLPAGAPMVLAPGSYRLRLTTVSRALRRGDEVPIVLVLESADGGQEEIAVSAEVRERSTVDEHLSPRGH